jgi:hypothetical protein
MHKVLKPEFENAYIILRSFRNVIPYMKSSFSLFPDIFIVAILLQYIKNGNISALAV